MQAIKEWAHHTRRAVVVSSAKAAQRFYERNGFVLERVLKFGSERRPARTSTLPDPARKRRALARRASRKASSTRGHQPCRSISFFTDPARRATRTRRRTLSRRLRLPFSPVCSPYYAIHLEQMAVASKAERRKAPPPPPPPPKRVKPTAPPGVNFDVESQLNQLRRSPRKECGLFFYDIGGVVKKLGPELGQEYAAAVARPMDLCQVLRSCRQGKYADKAGALADIRLCADNAVRFWRPRQHPAAAIVMAQADALLEWCKGL